jgi:hypothetical protein
VGGGYEPFEIERFALGSEYRSVEGAIQKAKETAAQLNAKLGRGYQMLGGWEAVEPLEVERYDQLHARTVTFYRPQYVKTTKNTLAIVALHLMYDEAIKHYVPFEKPTEEVPAFLRGYYEYAKLSVSKAYSYDANSEGAHLKDALSHHSARDPAHIYDNKIDVVSPVDAVLHDAAESGNDALYYDKDGHKVDGRKHPELADHVAREIYANDLDEAVLPGSKKTKTNKKRKTHETHSNIR